MARSSGALEVLLLAGTAEARAVAEGLAKMPGIAATASLAGVTRKPAAFAVPVRTGGFGGAAGLAAWLRRESVAAVIDATHPFAERMQANAVEACAAAGVPRLRLLRPAWPARPGWTVVESLAAAAAALPSGARALLTSGRDAAAFAARTDCRFWLRSIEPTALPAGMRAILARPPFQTEEEQALMRRLGVTHLVAKNSGGDPAKLDAAEELGIAVVMVARPAPPPGPVADTAAQALAWVAGLVAGRPPGVAGDAGKGDRI